MGRARVPARELTREATVAGRSAGNGAAAGGGAVYGLGLIGAAVYYLLNVNGVWDLLLAIPKAIVWPAILVYELFAVVYG
jgi:hypothetical protein